MCVVENICGKNDTSSSVLPKLAASLYPQAIAAKASSDPNLLRYIGEVK